MLDIAKCHEEVMRAECTNPVANLLLGQMQYQVQSYMKIKGMIDEDGQLQDDEKPAKNCQLLVDYAESKISFGLKVEQHSLFTFILIFMALFIF
uniref:Uncharacterized protein n=1 Tax=Ditylenchus dipsaci TaxID=166011 RepID=A0A915DM33_9BILA